MKISRRNFLKVSLAISGLSLTSKLPIFNSTAFARKSETCYGICYDSTKCIGCKACQIECMKHHNLSKEPESEDPKILSANAWTFIETVNVSGQDVFITRRCFHCKDAACVSACPTGAIHYNKSGIVRIDQAKCIGCNYCVANCPFNVPSFSLKTNTSWKCVFCTGKEKEGDKFDRISKGELPACVSVCPVQALTYGKVDELLEAAKNRLEELKNEGYKNPIIYGDDEAGGTNVILILGYDDLKSYKLPSKAGIPVGVKIGKYLKGPFNSIPLIGLLIAVVYNRISSGKIIPKENL